MATEKPRRNAQTKEELLLSDIWKELAVISGGGGTTGLSLESTQLSVLNAIVASDQDIEILLVRDNGSGGKVYQQITDYTVGVPTVIYKDVDGLVVVPVGPLEYLDPSAVLNLILSSIQAQGTTPLSTEATLLLANALLTTIDSNTAALVLDKDFELIVVNDVTNNVLVKQRTVYTAGVAVVSYENMDGTAYAGVGPVYEFLSGGDTSLLATEATLLTIAPVAQTLTSLSSNVAGSVLAGQRAVSFFLDGPGGTLNGVVRPNGWSQTFEFDNDTTPEITYVGTATCTIYIDYLT